MSLWRGSLTSQNQWSVKRDTEASLPVSFFPPARRGGGREFKRATVVQILVVVQQQLLNGVQ